MGSFNRFRRESTITSIPLLAPFPTLSPIPILNSDLDDAANKLLTTDRVGILDAVKRARDFKLCLRRVWAVAASLPGRQSSLPKLVPVTGKISIPGHDGEQNEHEQCTFDFCEQSRLDFTSLEQRHEESQHKDPCDSVYFPLDVLTARVEAGKSTAWELDDKFSLLDNSRPYMAISHVWADGTGAGIWGPGRVNKCLYVYFCDIARQFQCEGCWWDTISIPRKALARAKALSTMHNNYTHAKITLVHDLYLRRCEWIDEGIACFAIVNRHVAVVQQGVDRFRARQFEQGQDRI